MRRDYSGAAGPAQLTIGIPALFSNPQTISCDDLTNWPDGDGGNRPFFVVIDRDTNDEEKILCSSRSGNVLTVYYNPSTSTSGRGADGTQTKAHGANATIEHVFTATDADEANEHVNSSSGVHGVSGSVVGTTDTQTLTNKTLTTPTVSGGTFTNTVLNTPDINNASDATLTNPVITGGTASNFPPIGSIIAYGGATAPDSQWLICDGAEHSKTGTYAALFAIIGTAYGETNGSGGAGTSHFRLPNLKAKVPVGVSSGDTEHGTLGQSGGSKTSTAAHTHDIDHNHASFTSANASVDHTHGMQNHTHSGTTSTNGAHSHNVDIYDRTSTYGSGGLTAVANWPFDPSAGGYGTTSAGDHQHTMTTGGPSNNTTTGQSATHSHSIDVPALGTTASGPSSTGATAGNLQPYLTVNYIIKAL